MPTYSLRYTKKDVVVKNFLEADSNEITTSNIIELAILYFYKTKTYMPLGTVSVADEHPEKKVRTVYIQRHSEVSEIIAEYQKLGKGPKKLICEIIENGVDIGSNTNILTFSEYLIRKKELNTLTTNTLAKPLIEKSESVVKVATQMQETKTEPIKQAAMSQPTQKAEPAAALKTKPVVKEQPQTLNNNKETSKARNQKQVLRFADEFIKCGSTKQ